MNGYQPYYLESQSRWVVGVGGKMSKYNAQVEVAKLNGEPEPPGPPRRPGRVPKGDAKMRQTAVWLEVEQIKWLKAQDKTMSEVMRDLINVGMSGAIVTALRNAMAYLDKNDPEAARACIAYALEELGADSEPETPVVSDQESEVIYGIGSE